MLAVNDVQATSSHYMKPDAEVEEVAVKPRQYGCNARRFACIIATRGRNIVGRSILLRAVVLASSSPRRRQLLEAIDLKFTVDPADILETIRETDDPAALARGLSLKKAQAVAARHRDSVIIAADTIGVLDGSILGKPASEDDAASMLGLLSGRCHRVITGLSVIDTGTGREITRSVETLVCFRKLGLEEIGAYVRSGEPMGKAGSYAIQGLGSLLVERINGDYFNVVGLPLNALALALREVGIDILNVSSG